MRRFVLGFVLTLAVLVPNLGNAQVTRTDTQPPAVTAAGQEWQTSGEPVLYNGAVFYPAGPTVFFDGKVMARIGTFHGVPLYADATLEPNSIVYVLVSSTQVRPYERKRSGDLAGTAGSRAPEFPIASSSTIGEETQPVGTTATAGGAATSSTEPRPVGTKGTVAPRPTRVQSIPRPQSNAGIWIEFDGARWHSAGPAVLYSPERFVLIGEYHGFPVYVDGKTDRIYVTAVGGGPLVPYKK